MNLINIKPIGLTPGVKLDIENEKFQFYGLSCPLNAFEFYEPIVEWFDEYVRRPLDETVLDLNLTYYNTASAKFLIKIMTKLNVMSNSGFDVKINWFYSDDDEDMKTEGEEFDSLLDIEFNYIPVNSEEEKTDDDAYFEKILNELS